MTHRVRESSIRRAPATMAGRRLPHDDHWQPVVVFADVFAAEACHAGALGNQLNEAVALADQPVGNRGTGRGGRLIDINVAAIAAVAGIGRPGRAALPAHRRRGLGRCRLGGRVFIGCRGVRGMGIGIVHGLSNSPAKTDSGIS